MSIPVLLDRLVSEKSLAEPHSVAKAASPTQQYPEAAAILSDHSDEDIFAWLKLVGSARSIEPIPEQHSGSAHLSPLQIQALFTLKDCPIDRLKTYLALARLDLDNGRTTATFSPGPSIVSGLSNSLSSSLMPSTPSLFGNVWPEPSQKYPRSAVPSPYGRQLATEDISRSLVNPTFSGYTESHYWCTVCEHPNSYKDKGDWKKHEKGHETVFVCGLDNVVEDGWGGQKSSTKAFSCKRRDVMVNHLVKLHGIKSAQQGRDLADQWRVSEKKQAWSCGFCVNVFLNFQDRLKHIDTEHFSKYENIQDWDHNKVIHGLLMQPKMRKAWRKGTAALLSWVQPEDLVWTEDFAKHMRTKLEIGPSDDKDANRLANEVYRAGNPKQSLNESDMAPSTTLQTGRAGASPLLLSNQEQALTAEASGSGPEYHQRPSTMRATGYLYGGSLFGQSSGHAYDHDSSSVPSMLSLEVNGRGTHNAPSLHPPQDWIAAGEVGIGCSAFDEAVNEADRGFCPSTSGWNGH